jgi:hypothetical protein
MEIRSLYAVKTRLNLLHTRGPESLLKSINFCNCVVVQISIAHTCSKCLFVWIWQEVLVLDLAGVWDGCGVGTDGVGMR